MFVYLDESGDTGFKFNQGSSRYFVLTILLTPDPLPLNAAIIELRTSLGFHDRYEFKFYNSRDAIRRDFLRLLTQHDLLIRTLVVDKHQLTSPQLHDRTSFYDYLVRCLLQHDGGRITNAKLILDQREKGKKSQQSLGTYLRREINASQGPERKITDIRYHESHRDNLLQAVDMACGAINAHYARGKPEYLRIIRTKIDDIWEFQPT